MPRPEKEGVGLERAGAERERALMLRDDISGVALDPAEPLMWRRSVPLAPHFELRQGGAIFGEMEPAESDEADAAGECLGRSLSFRLEVGFLPGIRVETRRADGLEVGPSFRGLLFGWGRMGTPAGELLRWRPRLVGIYDHVLLDPRGRELLRLRPAFLRFANTETRVLVSALGWARDDLPELLLLSWFLRVHSERGGRRVFRRRRRRSNR